MLKRKNDILGGLKMNRRILMLVAVLSAFAATAQNDGENVTIEGVYKPKITKFDKLRFTPEVEKDVYSAPEFKVTLMPFDFRFTVETEILSPVRLTEQVQTVETSENFLMAAFGSRLSPEFMYRHNSELTKTTQIGVGIKHVSSWLDIKDYAPSSFMNNDFYVSLFNDMTETQVKSEIFYKNGNYHYYGQIDTLDLINADDIKQVYNTVGLKSQMFSKKAGVETVNYKIGAEYNLTTARNGLFENWATINGSVGYMANLFGFGNSIQTMGVDGHLEFDALHQNNLLFRLNPFFYVKGGFFRLRLGAIADVRNVAADAFAVYPDFSGSLFVFDNKVEFYAGISGGTRIIRFADLIEENPFLNANYFLDNTREQAVTITRFAFQGGARTNIIERLDLHFDVRYKMNEHEAFYVQDTTSGINAFGLVFDNCGVLRLNAEADWRASEKLEFRMSAVINTYKCDSLDHAPYKPLLALKVGTGYKLNEKIKLSADGVLNSRRFAYVYDGAGKLAFEPVKPFFDMQFKGEYAVNDNFGVFVRLSDMLFSKYQLYYNYPVSGFQAYAGFSLCF